VITGIILGGRGSGKAMEIITTTTSGTRWSVLGGWYPAIRLDAVSSGLRPANRQGTSGFGLETVGGSAVVSRTKLALTQPVIGRWGQAEEPAPLVLCIQEAECQDDDHLPPAA